MDLRKAEQDLETISIEWKALRRKRPRWSDGGGDVGEVVELSMPSWHHLMSTVNDEELFQSEEDNSNEDDDDDGGGWCKNEGEMEYTIARDDNVITTMMDADFGMCLSSSGKNHIGTDATNVDDAANRKPNIWDKYAAKVISSVKSKVATEPVSNIESLSGDPEEEEQMHVEDASPETILARLDSLHARFTAIGPKIDKFHTKLAERDPVTKKPRYGEKTKQRMKAVIRTYRALKNGLTNIFEDSAKPSMISLLRSQIQQHNEHINATKQARLLQEQVETERLVKERILAEEREIQQRLQEEKRKQDEERELARRAEEARVRRLEEEQAVIDAERRADSDLLALVPIIGVEGVREQIGRMRDGLRDDRASLDLALGSLYTLFEQIIRKPEEVSFRRVRRNHPKFVEDIGRHVGGREVLIAAGFKLEKLDGVPCFFSAEPHIESDMDGWSNWFDTLKKTLTVIEEEMLKHLCQSRISNGSDIIADNVLSFLNLSIEKD